MKDPWYNSLLMQCRNGDLSNEAYAFLHGLPTQHCGSWWKECMDDGSVKVHTCRNGCDLSAIWHEMAKKGSGWAAMQALECETCCIERDRRNRIVAPDDQRIHVPPFLHAPYTRTTTRSIMLCFYGRWSVPSITLTQQATRQPPCIFYGCSHRIHQSTDLNLAEQRSKQKRKGINGNSSTIRRPLVLLASVHCMLV